MLLSLLTGVLLEAAPVIAQKPGMGLSLTKLILDADIVIKLTLLILLAMSVISWAIMFVKHKQFKNIDTRNKTFFRKFWGTSSISELIKTATFKKCPAFNIFKSAMDEIQQHGKMANPDFVARDIRRATDDEIYDMESLISFLATTGSTAPFWGLFGTVWGIMFAFWDIGFSGTTSIVVVGPHVASALIATAAGLVAAIPAVVIYNYFNGKIRALAKDLMDFAEDLNHRIEKEYFSK